MENISGSGSIKSQKVSMPSRAHLASEPELNYLEIDHSRYRSRHHLSAATLPSPSSVRSKGLATRSTDEVEKRSMPLSPNYLRYPSISIDAQTWAAPPHQGLHMLSALLFISLPALLLSFATLIFTIAAIISAIVASPLRLCIENKHDFTDSLTSVLVWGLSLQYRCIFNQNRPCRPHSPYVSEFPARSPPLLHPPFENHNFLTVLIVNLLSPLVASPLTIAAWVVGIFWLLSAVTANEQVDDSPKGGSEDGRRLAQHLLRWWVWWLGGHLLRPES